MAPIADDRSTANQSESNIRFGSLADIVQRPRPVRSSLKADIGQRALHVRYVLRSDLAPTYYPSS